MKTIIRGKEYDLSQEEIDFVKTIYGYWEEDNGVYIFDMPEMIPMRDLVKILGITRQAINERHNYNAEKYPLHRFGSTGFIYDYELEVWKSGTRNKLLNN